ncbi:MAG TPA: ArsC family transcriptional regulator, partial [Candidatus Limiplasma merdipullorum]|nr:ArsC family transcriptional regulator [Candidatus Limiplasma merdipullorum]
AELMNDPMALVSPIVRNGSRVTVGADEAEWKRWVELEKAAAR